jgi:hypothetical protein
MECGNLCAVRISGEPNNKSTALTCQSAARTDDRDLFNVHQHNPEWW